MGEFISNKYVTIRAVIDGVPKEADFEFVTSTLSTLIEPGSLHVLVKCLQVSVDPYQLNRMKSRSRSHNSIDAATKLVPGQPIDGQGTGRVIASGHPGFQKGDLVTGHLTWSEYALIKDGKSLTKLHTMEFPLSYHLGILGFSGLAAYVGFFKICKPKKGEKILVSAASGSVGNVVGQYAKLFGCHVVGCAGAPQKVALLKGKLGFDDAFNYKEEADLNLALKRYFPEGIDMYFDNVGGEMLEAAVANMNTFGRIAVCGVISQYTDPTKKLHAPDMIDVIYKRINIRGFLVVDFMGEVHQEFISVTSDHLRARRIQVLEDISHGLESIPSAFVGLFRGHNVGKAAVQICSLDH